MSEQINHSEPYDAQKPLMIVVMVSAAGQDIEPIADVQGPASW